MFESMFKELRLQVYDRLNSPLLASFIVSWSLWNYKFFVILLSKASVTQTFELIQAHCFPSSDVLWERALFWPLLTTAAYLFLYPYPARWVYRFVKLQQQKLVDIRQEVEAKQRLSLEDSVKLRNGMRKLQLVHIEELKERDTEIEELRMQLDVLLKESKELGGERKPNPEEAWPFPVGPRPSSTSSASNEDNLHHSEDVADFLKNTGLLDEEPIPSEKLKSSKFDFVLSDAELRILQAIGSSGNATVTNIASNSEQPRYLVEHSIVELQDRGLITLKDDGRSVLTDFGRMYLIETLHS